MEEAKEKVKDYMSKNVITVSPDKNLEEVMMLMRRSHHDGFPVVDGDKIVGIITTRDIMLKKGSKVKDVMTKKVVVTFPYANITDVARVMFRKGLSKLPVINEKKELIGIITNTDILRSHIERATPSKVRKIKDTIEKLYSIKTVVRLAPVNISDLIPTQGEVQPDEFKGREYELKRGLAEPIVVIKSGGRKILVDGHHRVLAALRMGIEIMDAYLIVLSKDIELGLEKTAKMMGLRSLNDIKIAREGESGVMEVISY